MNPYTIFNVEGYRMNREIRQYHLSLNPNYKIIGFETAKDCLNSAYQRLGIATIDFSFPDIQRNSLYQKIRKTNPLVPVVASGFEK
jgi:FixJ family two-component response regulator|nr:FixJ family two-component response regulator [Mucilaginibacter sp. FT3.2]